MDISKITDIKELKALAFDQIVELEQVQLNIKRLNARMVELGQSQAEQVKANDESKKSR